jgi:serine/threonine protein phosphatase PrpC
LLFDDGGNLKNKQAELQDEMDEPIGPARVWLGDAGLPGLAMSRSIGDKLAASCGVSSFPEVSVVSITPDDQFVIWASDGIWEFISSQKAAEIVSQCQDAPEACRVLTDAAKECWAVNEPEVSDDISCVIVFFKHSDLTGVASSSQNGQAVPGSVLSEMPPAIL